MRRTTQLLLASHGGGVLQLPWRQRLRRDCNHSSQSACVPECGLLRVPDRRRGRQLRRPRATPSSLIYLQFSPHKLVHGTVFSSIVVLYTHSTLECQTPTVHVSTAPPGATSLLQPAAIVYRVNSWHACSRLDVPSSNASISPSLAPLGRHLKAWVRILRAELEVATKRSMRCARDALDWYRTHIAIPSPRTTKTLVRMKSRAVSYPVADNCCVATPSPRSRRPRYRTRRPRAVESPSCVKWGLRSSDESRWDKESARGEVNQERTCKLATRP